MTNSQTPAPLVANTGDSQAHPSHPRIYVACLAAYNNGRLHGRWIDASRGEDAIFDAVQVMLADSPEPDAEEWAIHDYENFHGCHISEYAGFGAVAELAAFIEEHGALGAKLNEYFGNSLDEARAAFDDYAGEFASAAEFTEQLHDDPGTEIPTSLTYYIDWQALARDMALNGEIMVFQTGFDAVHVFWTR